MQVSGISVERRALLYLIGDLIIALLALPSGYALRLGVENTEFNLLGILTEHPIVSLVFIGTNLMTLFVAEAYDPSQDFRKRLTIARLWVAVFTALLMQMAIFYMLQTWWGGRSTTLFTNLCFVIMLTGWRALMSQVRPQLNLRRKTLILGINPAGAIIAQVIRSHPEQGQIYDLVGFFDAMNFGDKEGALIDLPVMGAPNKLTELVEERQIGTIIVAILGGMDSHLTQQLLDCKAAGVQIEDMRTVYKRLTGKIPIHYLTDTSLIFGPAFSGIGGLERSLQRLSDIVIALIGLTLTAPMLGLAAVAILLESGRPIFYTQERVGQNEKPFTIIKLRTMTTDAEAKTGPVWSQGAGDPRVTRVGAFLRKTRIDELPQFYNVLRGDMAVIGPRPERQHFVDQLKEKIPFYALRFAVNPGLTGWAQVRYRYGASEEDAAEKLSFELYAIQELTPLLYVLILLKTVQTVLLRPGS
jgi:sugar transferase (PEP-CTERM system associated)